MKHLRSLSTDDCLCEKLYKLFNIGVILLRTSMRVDGESVNIIVHI